MHNIHNIAIFASGEGTNADRIMSFFKDHSKIRVVLVLCNKENAGVIKRTKKHKVKSISFKTRQIEDTLPFLLEHKIDYIILAGFLAKIPQNILEYYKDKILNIHPSLLPKYGGKGMYGLNVHKAVIDNKEKKTGITIHVVNEDYDKGEIVLQTKIDIDTDKETPESLQKKVNRLEYMFYPGIIEEYISRPF